MTEEQWLRRTDPLPMLECLRASGRATERKLRLFGVACCRRIWDLLTDERGRRAAEITERYADGLATRAELLAAAADADASSTEVPLQRRLAGIASVSGYGREWQQAYREAPPHEQVESTAACAAAQAAAWRPMRMPKGEDIPPADFTAWLATAAAEDAANGNPVGQEKDAQGDFLRCLFGNPFHLSPPLPPALFAWNDGSVRRLAEAAYEHRSLPDGHLDPARLAILADALEDAGCADPDLLGHLRGPGSHVRGCFALDLLLGRE